MRKPARRLFRGKDRDPSLVPSAVLEALRPADRRRLLESLARKAPTGGPCAICNVPSVRWRPILVLEPDARLFGMREGQSFLSAIHVCADHDNDSDAAAFRSALIAEAKGNALSPPERKERY